MNAITKHVKNADDALAKAIVAAGNAQVARSSYADGSLSALQSVINDLYEARSKALQALTTLQNWK